MARTKEQTPRRVCVTLAVSPECRSKLKQIAAINRCTVHTILERHVYPAIDKAHAAALAKELRTHAEG